MSESRQPTESRSRLGAVESTAESESGLVSATVGVVGDVRSLWLDPRIYRSRDAAALAEDITQAVREATEAARQEAFDLLKPDLAPGATVQDTDFVYDPVLAALDRHTGRRPEGGADA